MRPVCRFVTAGAATVLLALGSITLATPAQAAPDPLGGLKGVTDIVGNVAESAVGLLGKPVSL